MKTLNDM